MQIIKVTKNTERGFVLSRGFTDLIKFVAALMIAYCHFSSYAIGCSDNLIYRIVACWNPGVALFFFLSGYGLMMSEMKEHLSLWPFIKRRLAKVYLPVVLVSFIWQLILLLKTGSIDGDRVLHILYATFFGFSDGILWYVKAIMICYILFRIYIAFHNSVGVLIVGTIIVYFLIYHLFADWAAISIPLFSLGILIADHNEEAYKCIKSYKVIILLLFITILMSTLYFWLGNLYLKSLCNWYAVIAVLLFCVNFYVEIQVPIWMGNIAYDIYITHNKVINYMRPLYGYIGFWRFTLVAAVVVFIFYSLRKLLRI